MSETTCLHRPLIGIAPSRDGERPTVSRRYLDAVWRAGGLGVILPYTTDEAKIAEYAMLFDGVLFSGGVDVNPVLYGEEKQFDSVEIDDERDAFEKALFAAVYPKGTPILGICRGIQSINVFLGGTLHQHIEGHRQDVGGEMRTHAITIAEGSMFHRICGKTSVMVNTFHHQTVKEPAPGLLVDAVGPDGHIEALHSAAHPFLFAVQFHPEIYNACDDDDHSRAIFKAFIEACQS